MKHVEEFVVQNTMFKGQENSGTALELIETTAQIVNSTFVSNRKGSYRKCPITVYCLYGFFGGAIIATNSIIDISRSNFEYNGAELNVYNVDDAFLHGGVLYSDSSNIIIVESQFQHNSADEGGVLYSSSSNITINASEFHNNSVTVGGILRSYSSNITINASEFHNNSANAGGVLRSYSSNITINASEFHNNSAIVGGVLDSHSSNITIKLQVNFIITVPAQEEEYCHPSAAI